MTNNEFLLFILFAQLIPALACPGPSTILAMTTANSRGKTYGIMISLGIAIGCLIWFIFVSYGLSEIFQKSPMLKNTITLLGSIYMLYLSYTIIKKFDIDKVEKVYLETKNSNKKGNLFDDFLKGLITTILNPEAPTFFVVIFQQVLTQHNDDKNIIKYYIVIFTFVTFAIISLMAVGANVVFSLFKKHKKYMNLILGLLLFITASRILYFALISII